MQNVFMLFLKIAILSLVCLNLWAQNESDAKVQKGMITSDEAYIFQEANFDAAIITVLNRGQIYWISKEKIGPFYRIQLQPGTIGYVLDSDIKPSRSAKVEGKEKKSVPKQEEDKPRPKIAKKSEPKDKKESKDTRRKPFANTRYRGLILQSVNFTEDTMKDVRSQSLLFYGFRWSGQSALMSGMYTDANVLFHFAAPAYYETKTGRSASGWVSIIDFLFEIANPNGRDILFFYGFGPMLRLSHFDVSLNESGKQVDYAMDDMNLGAAFNVGLAFRLGSSYALRSEAKYYWEKQKYYSLGLAFQFEF